MSNINSINIRFPRQIIGVGRKLLPYIKEGEELLNTLIVSGPGHGKTTLLRDLVRIVSDGEGIAPRRCLVVDERSEICGTLGGKVGFDVGLRTDVLDSVNRSEGIVMGIRSLSPYVIATDEVGRRQDLLAVSECLNSGVKLLLTAHGGDKKQIVSRMFFRDILEEKMIERYVFLSSSLGKGTVEGVFDRDMEPVLDVPFLLGQGGEL